MTISIGLIRFLRSASRSSATVLASTPALRAPPATVFAVPLAALRAVCLRARALPPLLAAALREEALRLEADLDADEALRPEDDFAALDRPDDDFAALDRPDDDFAALDRPDDDFAALDRPDDDFAALRPDDDFAALDRPEDDFAVEDLARLDDFAFEPEPPALLLLPPLPLCATTHSLRCLLSGGLSHERCHDGRVV
jgi:hypothetical protein